MLLMMSACGSEAAPTPSTEAAADNERPGTLPVMAATLGGRGGTRYIEGKGFLPTAGPIDVDLPGRPEWVVGLPVDDAVVWWVALESGQLFEVRESAGAASEPVLVGELPPGAPPAVALRDGDVTLIRDPSSWGSAGSHPVALGDGTSITLESDGSITVDDTGGVSTYDVGAPPDARLLLDEDALLVVAGATTRYPHGAVGDSIEGSSAVVIDLALGRATKLFELLEPAVIEGTTPMWTDLDGDGSLEIVVTVSDSSIGARLVLYDASGRETATGGAIGTGNRWRHQVAAAPFGPEGEIEIAAVLTPHIGGTVEFYQWRGDRLEIVARVPGFSSHQFRSPNLDMALAADADGDGRVELVVPTDDYRDLGGIRRVSDRAEVVWMVPVGGLMVTNLGSARRSGGTLSFAVGRSDGVLRIWP